MCRTDWGAFTWRAPSKRVMAQRNHSAAPSCTHPGSTCSACNAAPISGPRYSCTSCWKLDLCHKCFSSGTHPQHDFVVCQRVSSSCQPAARDLFEVACTQVCVQGSAHGPEVCLIEGRGRVTPVKGAFRSRGRPGAARGTGSVSEARAQSHSGLSLDGHASASITGICGRQSLGAGVVGLEHVPARKASTASKLRFRQQGSSDQIPRKGRDLGSGVAGQLRGLTLSCSEGMARMGAVDFAVVGQASGRGPAGGGCALSSLPSVRNGR